MKKIDKKTRLILWKVALGLGRLDRGVAFFVGDEEITGLFTYDKPLVRYNWDTKTVELTERGKKCL